MKRNLLTLMSLATLCLGSFLPVGATGNTTMKKVLPLTFDKVKITDSFWSPRLDKHKTATLPVCIDQIENKTGRMQNFINAAKRKGKHSGIFFDDSDVYKALEGIANSLINHPDATLEKKADEWIDNIAAAQLPDGYINTYFTLTGLQNRFTNMDKHEMYCAGHLLEAGVAYKAATGKDKLLNVGRRMADYLMTVFGPGKRNWVPGHEEIELALVKLFEVTGEKKYLTFANWLLEERGHGYGTTGGNGDWNSKYYQDEVPVSQLESISGHAVRSMYLYCGMADVAAYTGNTTYIAALNRLWEDVVKRNMYITGGIGQSAHNEGFTEDYDLPNLEAYCETCASVGMVYWNSRMNQITGDSKYVDVLERAMYNGALAGINLAGDHFFYVNPLESKGDHHRQEWYGCACCPSQLSRFIPSIGNYIYGVSKDALWVNLFIGSSANVGVGKSTVTITQKTQYPWYGKVELNIKSTKPLKNEQLRIRIPDWCKKYTLMRNGKPLSFAIDKGYAVIKNWRSGDKFTFNMNMPVTVVAADSKVKADVGKRAVQRGPIVYCEEEADNKSDYDDAISPSTKFNVTPQTEKLGGIMQIEAKTGDKKLEFIPYYSWDNRDAGRMKVWIDYASTPKE